MNVAEAVEMTTSTMELGKRDVRPAYLRPGRLTFLAVVATIGLAACGGGSHTPGVASLGTSSTPGTQGDGGSGRASIGNTATTLPAGNASPLLDEWATCMRSHGDPDQADPTIDSDKEIHIYIVAGPQDPASGELSNEVHAGTAPCNQYLTAAQRALRDGQPFPQPPSEVQEAKYAECMRANGVPNYPNPSGPDGSETNFRGTGIDPNSPLVQNADKKCTQQVGIHTAYNSAQGDAGNIIVQSGPAGGPPGGPGGNGGSGANSGPVPVSGGSS